MLPGSVQSPERPDAADPVLTLQLREAEAAGAPRSPLLRGPPPTSPTSPAGPPRPPGLSDEDAAAWAWFCALDQDGSGGLDRDEMWPLVKKVGLNISRRQFERKFGELDPSATGAVSFNAFNVWWRGMRETERREMRRQVKDVFDAVDTDQSGRLSKAEFAKLVSRAKKHLRLVPPFDLDKDWRLCKTIRYGDNEEELTYPAFERWWKERLGVDDADIPVLPEHMVMMADEQSELARKLNKDPVSIASSPRRQRRGQRRTGKVLWGILRPRVLSIVRMQRQWGQLHEIYESNQESRFMLTPVPKYIKDPDSSFSGFWDIAQVILLLYVSIIVPLRAGFQIATPLWTFAFFFDAFVDVYFIVDLGLNFRTAYYRRDGTREDRPRKIAENYLSGWFSVDFFSCVPVSYVEYFLDTAPLLLDDSGSGAVHGAAVRDAAGGSGSNFKVGTTVASLN
jgi:Ca2+-binding EF-hand superfamily protein